MAERVPTEPATSLTGSGSGALKRRAMLGPCFGSRFSIASTVLSSACSSNPACERVHASDHTEQQVAENRPHQPAVRPDPPLRSCTSTMRRGCSSVAATHRLALSLTRTHSGPPD